MEGILLFVKDGQTYKKKNKIFKQVMIDNEKNLNGYNIILFNEKSPLQRRK